MSTDPGSPDGSLGSAESVANLKSRLEDLAALGGRAKVTSMLKRLCDQLQGFLQTPVDQDWPPAEVHRMVGLAAMLGFSQVEASWRRVEAQTPQGDSRPAARAAASAAICFVKEWS